MQREDLNEGLKRGLGDAPLPDPEGHWQQIRSRLAEADGPELARSGWRDRGRDGGHGMRGAGRVHPALAIAAGFAAIVLGVGGGVVYHFRAPAEWEVVAHEGNVGSTALASSEWLETDSTSTARLKVGRIGTVAVGPGSRARLVRGAWNAHRMVLERGVIDAVIAAPPRLFFVETPTALATDLGCAYQLRVADDGSSTLHVTVGWVELSHEGQHALVPAGLIASVSRDGVPGIPQAPGLRIDESQSLDTVLAALDAYDAGKPENIRRQTSGITLWHLLSRVERDERSRIVAALEQRAPRPDGVTMEGILALDRQMLDRWRRALHPMWGEEPAPLWVAAAQRIWLWVMD
jgi:hypothetical protein